MTADNVAMIFNLCTIVGIFVILGNPTWLGGYLGRLANGYYAVIQRPPITVNLSGLTVQCVLPRDEEA